MTIMAASLVLRNTLDALPGSLLHGSDQSGTLTFAFYSVQACEIQNLINRWIGQTGFSRVHAERFQFNNHVMDIDDFFFGFGTPGKTQQIRDN